MTLLLSLVAPHVEDNVFTSNEGDAEAKRDEATPLVKNVVTLDAYALMQKERNEARAEVSILRARLAKGCQCEELRKQLRGLTKAYQAKAECIARIRAIAEEE